MKTFTLRNFESMVEVAVSCFTGTSGVEEYHISLNSLVPAGIEIQLERIKHAYMETIDSYGIGMESSVFRRFFCSDLANQAPVLEERDFSCRFPAENPCCVSWICQPPGHTGKVSLWAYHVFDRKKPLEKSMDEGSLILKRGSLSHVWTQGITCTRDETSYEQSRGILDTYSSFLRKYGITLSDDVVRTWFFVRNIDTNYKGFVTARREYFAASGLTVHTHFIASTGVEGSHVDVAARVSMDAYAVSGLLPGQVAFLSAPENLSSTYVYGVTFERGVSVSYRDRKHVILSGTASIDGNGSILHKGDVLRQLDRTVENMEALLKKAGAGIGNIVSLTAYVRDLSDFDLVKDRMRHIFPASPIVTCCASVCRPGWLVEVEGMAIIPNFDPGLPLF